MIKKCTFLFVFILTQYAAHAGLFYEHKFIGDSAFKKFVYVNDLTGFFTDSLHFKQYGANEWPSPLSSGNSMVSYYPGMFKFTDTTGSYSYGDFTGLSGDHSIDPIQLEQALLNQQQLVKNLGANSIFSGLIPEVTVALQNHYAGIAHYQRQGSYNKPIYVSLASEDNGHFQRPPLSIEDMLLKVNPEMVRVAYSFFTADSVSVSVARMAFDSALLKLDNAGKYAIMHLLALEMMKLAAENHADYLLKKLEESKYKTDVVQLRNLALMEAKYQHDFIDEFEGALIINAFADHFLEDAFAAGHMATRRNWNSLGNKGVHDYYNHVGINVKNENGEWWRTFGDNCYDDTTFAKAIHANLVSLNEIWQCFQYYDQEYFIKSKTIQPPLFEKLYYADINPKIWPAEIKKSFTAYGFMPVPLAGPAYRDSIKMKNNTRDDPFGELAYAYSFFPSRIVKNFMLEAALGTGYDVKTPGPAWHHKRSAFARSIESLFWFGFSVNYSYLNYAVTDAPRKNEQRIGGGLHFIFFDLLAIDQMLGGAIVKQGGGFVSNSAVGFEFKGIGWKGFAPSLKYFVEYEDKRALTQGIKLSLRLY